MITRRGFITATGILITSRFTLAQPAKIPRIGYLAPSVPEEAIFLKAFRDGLRELGYVEGQTIIIERRSTKGRLDALPALVQEVVKLKVDVIVAPTTPVARAAMAATSTIPIVFTIVSDPVGSELVSSFAHPGGNVTGMTDMGVGLTGKRLELLKQIVPHLKRAGALGHPQDKVWDGIWREAPGAAHRLGIELIPVPIATPEEFDTTFAELNRRVEALMVAPQVFFSLHRRKVIELAALTRLPAIYELRAFPDAGGLMSYGPDYPALFRKAARHVDKILKGAKPADLPVEEPTEYELVINLKAAKSIGLNLPQSILARADDIIR